MQRPDNLHGRRSLSSLLGPMRITRSPCTLPVKQQDLHCSELKVMSGQADMYLSQPSQAVWMMKLRNRHA